MASNGTYSVCVLWASEVRAASLALHELSVAMREGKATDEMFRAALQSSHTALLGAYDKPNIVVCEGDRLVMEPRVYNINTKDKEEKEAPRG